MADILSVSEAKELIRLCRSGKLYEIEQWIATGKSLCVPPEIKKTPLQVAVGTGFHSLVQTLARSENCQSVKNDALLDAVQARKRELADVLLEQGADPVGIPFVEVLRSWDPALMKLFLAAGVDAISDDPFAFAFVERIRTALRPFVDFKKAHPELEIALQAQVDKALRYFCDNKDLKWVSLLIWAGANPRSMGPRVYEVEDPELYTTAMEQAAYAGDVEVFRRLKPDAKTDDLGGLLTCAVTSARADMVEYLLGLGAGLNQKPNGGSAAIDRCISMIHINGIRPGSGPQLKSTHAAHESLEIMRMLAKREAVWRPNDGTELQWSRKILLEFETELTLELLKIFVEHNACSRETLRDLLNHPRMRERLAGERWWLSRLKLKDLIVDPREQKRRLAAPRVADIPKSLLARYGRQELYTRVWSQPVHTVAKECGMSDVGLAKICRKLLVPIPGRGYWAKKAAGKPLPKRPPLPT